MQIKLLEVRDDGTFIPVIAVDMNIDDEAQRYLLRRCGYPCNGRPNIAISALRADGSPFCNDPYQWGGRTYPVAHEYILQNWETLKTGDVVDVEFILGERPEPKKSERFTAPV